MCGPDIQVTAPAARPQVDRARVQTTDGHLRARDRSRGLRDRRRGGNRNAASDVGTLPRSEASRDRDDQLGLARPLKLSYPS